jgi:hypothetical protein
MPTPNRNPSTPQELRKFGYQIGGIFLALSALFLWRKGVGILCVVTALLGTYLVVFGALKPELLAGFNRFWWKLSDFLGRYVGHYVGLAFFTILYWILFAPVAVIMRIVGFDPLGLRRHRNAASYWHERPAPLSSDHYEHQFSIEKRDYE